VNARLYTAAVALNTEWLEVLSVGQRATFSIVLDMLTAHLRVMSAHHTKTRRVAKLK
jgi:hypothetical protein